MMINRLPEDTSIVFVNSMDVLESSIQQMQKEAVLGWDSEFSHGNNIFSTVSLIQIAGEKTMYVIINHHHYYSYNLLQLYSSHS